MKTITQKELNIAIKLHAFWIHGLSNGVRLKLSGYNLINNNFRGCDLRGSDLSHCIISSSSLNLANLGDAYLKDVNFIGKHPTVNFNGAYLGGATFTQGV